MMLTAQAERIVDAVEAVEREDYCFCGQPLRSHKFWDDKIYDVQGYQCPGPVGGEYRRDVTRTAWEWRRRKVDAVLAAVLAAPADNFFRE